MKKTNQLSLQMKRVRQSLRTDVNTGSIGMSRAAQRLYSKFCENSVDPRNVVANG